MVAIPTLFVVVLIWFPAIASVLLSFTNWNGIGSLGHDQGHRPRELRQRLHELPAVLAGAAAQPDLARRAVRGRDAARHLLAVLLDKEIRFSRFYQTALYLPVVLSLALVGFIWQLIYSRDQGLLNAVLGTQIDWYGDPNVQPVGGARRHLLAARRLRDAAVPGRAEGGRRSLREAAAIDGATEMQTFFRVVFPVMRPINIIVLVITVIESLRAFDLVWVSTRAATAWS